MNNYSAGNFVVESSITSIKATIHGRKKWVWFLPSLFVFLINAFCLLPILGLVIGSLAQKYLPGNIQAAVFLLLLCLYLFILYKKSFDTLEYVFDKETIEINDERITVEKSGFLGLRNKKAFLAENIRGMTTSLSTSEQFSSISHPPFLSSSLGAFMIWQNGIKPFYNFGKGVSQSDAQNLINTIYSRFPKYRFSGAY